MQRKEFAKQAIAENKTSIRKACEVFTVSRSYFSYINKKSADSKIEIALLELAKQKPTWGFSKIFQSLRNAGQIWNHKRVWRVYCELKLNLKRKTKKRLPSRCPQALAQPLEANLCWSMDFMFDALRNGRKLKTLNIIDDYNREALHIEIDSSLPAERVVRVLDMIANERGSYPAKLRTDNGPEFISKTLKLWAEKNMVFLDFIQPGKPTQNSYIERFNRTYREEVLNFYIFSTLTEAREHTEKFLHDYNSKRPHESLGNLSPQAFAAYRAVRNRKSSCLTKKRLNT